MNMLLPLAIVFQLIFLAIAVTAQVQNKNFKLSDASKNVDVEIAVGTCEGIVCQPPARFSFYRKGAVRPFQQVSVSRVEMWDEPPKVNVTLRYDEQSVINFGDFNFDGTEDVAVNDGSNGGYGMPSYRVYLYSKLAGRYVYSPSFTAVNNNGMNLGFMEIDIKKRMLYRFSKSGCCWHQTEGFMVVNGKPKKTYEFTEEILMYKPEVVEITTRKRINGKWREWVKHAKTSEYYPQ